MDLTDAVRLAPDIGPVAVWSPHPLRPAVDRELVRAVFYPGETIAEYLERTGLAAKIRHRPVLCTVNGYRVPAAMWPHIKPKPGTLVHLQAVVRGGGGGGKNPLATIASIALLVAAPWAAGVITSSVMLPTTILGISTGTFISGAINILGGLAINALFPPPKPQLRAPSQVDSPTYSLTGGQNRMRPYEPMPVIMGEHRVVPDFGAKPFTEFEGEDQYAYYVFDFGYNDLELSDYQIGATPVTDFEDVEIEESGADGVLEGFPGNVDTLDVSATLDVGEAFTQRTTSPDTTRIGIDIVGALFGVDGAGNVGPHHADLEVWYRPVGETEWEAFFPVVAQGLPPSTRRMIHRTRTPLRRGFSKKVPKGQYEVRARISGVFAGAAEATYFNELAWASMRSYQPDTADYTGRKRVALRIRASGQLSGVLQQFSALGKGRTEVWDGAQWATQHTRNPAWWYLQAARGRLETISGIERRVWGCGMDDTRIDIAAIQAFAAWCDAKSLTFDGVFDQHLSGYDMLSSIALCGRGTVSWGNGKCGVIWDAPDQPVVSVFSMSNIDLGSFEIEYVTENLADELIVGFINPALDWQRDTVRVLAPGVTAPVSTRTIEFFGCRDRDMAARAGNLYAAANVYRTRRYRWRSDYEGMTVTRGDVARLSHDLASMDYSGRFIEGGDTDTLKLERTVPLEAGGSWVTIVKPDGTISTHAVDGGAGETDTLTLSTPLGFNPWADANHPPYDYKWLYGPTATPGRLIKIESIRPLDHGHVEITAVDENPAYYAWETAPYTHLPPTPVFGRAPQLSNLEISETEVAVGSSYLARVVVTWDALGDYLFADVRVSVDGAPWETKGQEVRARSFSFDLPDQVEVAVEVRGYSSLGRLGRSQRVTASKFINLAALAPPSDVAWFVIDGDELAWQAVPDRDAAGYRLRYHHGLNTSWGNANRLHQGLITDSPFRLKPRPAGQVTIMVKAVDTAGLESEQPAVIVTDLGDPLVANVVETVDLKAAGFPGEVIDGAVDMDGNLAADDASGLMWDPDPDTSMWTTTTLFGFPVPLQFTPMWNTTVWKEMFWTTQITPRAAGLGSQLTLDHTIEARAYSIEYRRNAPNPMWSDEDELMWAADDAEIMWRQPPGESPARFYSSDGALIWAADADQPMWRVTEGGYQTWPGAIAVLNEPYDFRVHTAFGAKRGKVSAFTLSVDMPDIIERLNDVAIGAGGTRLPITKSYMQIRNVNLTVQFDGNGAVGARIEDKNATLGPLVKTINDTGTAVAGVVDATIQGY